MTAELEKFLEDTLQNYYEGHIWKTQKFDYKGRAMKTTKIESKVAVWAYQRGLKEGARRERRALQRFTQQGGVFISVKLAERYISMTTLLNWLKARALRAKRREGK